MKIFLAVFILVTGLAVVIYSEVKADRTFLKEKINKAIEKQNKIESKLEEVNKLMEQIRIRVYRKTGF